MEFRQVGKTGLSVSRICFGCFTAGGHGWGEVQDSESIASIQMAFEKGINFFDTADVYGMGHSEEVLRQALGSNLNEVVISTKGGVRYDQSKKQSFVDCSPEWITQALEASLKRLKREQVEIYTLHRFDQKVPLEKTIEVLEKHRDAGKIKELAFSNFPSSVLEQKDLLSSFSCCQYEYSLGKREIESLLAKICGELELSFFAYSPLMQGLLTGKYDLNTKFDVTDARSRHPNFKIDKRREVLKILESLKPKLRETGASFTQLAIAWLLQKEQVSSLICGVRNVSQLDEILGATSFEVDFN